MRADTLTRITAVVDYNPGGGDFQQALVYVPAYGSTSNSATRLVSATTTGNGLHLTWPASGLGSRTDLTVLQVNIWAGPSGSAVIRSVTIEGEGYFEGQCLSAPQPTATPTPTFTPTSTFTPTATDTPTFTPTFTPTPTISFPTPDLLLQPSAPLPRFSINPPASECVYGSSDGNSRRACAIRAYNAVWDHLASSGEPMTWDRFFAITLYGEAGILYSGVTIVKCGYPNTTVTGNSACQPVLTGNVLPAFERALIRQIVLACGSDGCSEDELITLLGGKPVPISQQTLGIEKWYNAGRTSDTIDTPDKSKLLGVTLTEWRVLAGILPYWATQRNNPDYKLTVSCLESGYACNWGNCTIDVADKTGLFWVNYQGAGTYLLPDSTILFIVGTPLGGQGQCRR